ncbi:MATE family efflux transporter [Candidatus Riflebacteria bacterium]
MAKLTEGPVSVTLLHLALPMSLGFLSIIGFNLADTYFVAQLGVNELAAISFTFPVVMFVGSMTIGLGIGTSSVIARSLGEGNKEKVKKLATHSLGFALLFSGFFLILGLATIKPLFQAMGASDELIPLIQDYMSIWYPGMLFLVIPMVGNSVIRATGDTKFPAMIMTLAAILNIILDPLLIFGYSIFPRLELQGAAIATVFARAGALFASLAVLHFREKLLDFHLPTIKELLDSWKNVLHVGLPAAASRVVVPLTICVITRFIAGFGVKAVAAYGIATRIEAFALIIIIGLSASIGPFIGQNWGAKKFDRVKTAINFAFYFSILWSFFLTITLLFFSQTIISFFKNDRAVIMLASFYLCIVSPSYGFQGIQLISSAGFNALGRPLPATFLTVIRMLFLYLPAAYIGGKYLGIYGIFSAPTIANLVSGVVAYLWVKKYLIEDRKNIAA